LPKSRHDPRDFSQASLSSKVVDLTMSANEFLFENNIKKQHKRKMFLDVFVNKILQLFFKNDFTKNFIRDVKKISRYG
jgi:hypothetical protein